MLLCMTVEVLKKRKIKQLDMKTWIERSEILMLHVALVAVYTRMGVADEDELYKDEDLFNNLTRNYDKRVLPITNGTPVEVQVEMHVNNMAETKPIHSHYQLMFVIHQAWFDKRLSFDESQTDDLRLVGRNAELIWIPDTTFESELGRRSKVTIENMFAVIESNGYVLLSQRLMVTMHCPMNFTSFPFDEQRCTFPILSYSYDDELLIMNWHKGTLLAGGSGASFDFDRESGPFHLESFTTSKIKRDYGFSGKHDTLTVTMRLQRKFLPYFVRIYLPLILIVLLSFTSFWIDYRSSPARTIMSATIFLTLMMFIVNLQEDLPPTKSIRSIDLYSLGCFLFVFCTLVEFAIVQSVDIRVKLRRKQKSARDNALGVSSAEHSSLQSRFRRRARRISPMQNDGSCKTTDDANARQKKVSFYQRAAERVYQEHEMHRNEYHVIDKISKRAFPIAFLIINTIYFLAYGL